MMKIKAKRNRILVTVLMISLLFGFVQVVEPNGAKTSAATKRVYKGIVASKIYQVGRNVYFSFSPSGRIIRYDTKTKKKTLVRGSDGGDYGYGSLIVRGKYIYAIWGEWSGAFLSPNDSIYRITTDGKKRELLKKGAWFDSGFAMVGSRVYYTNSKMEYDPDVGEELANKGSKASMKLNGTDRRSERGVKIKKSKQSAGKYEYGNRKIVTGNTTYIISRNEKLLKRGNRVVFKCKKKGTITRVDAHKSAVMVTVLAGVKNGVGILKVYYVNKYGKNKKYIGSYTPAG